MNPPAGTTTGCHHDGLKPGGRAVPAAAGPPRPPGGARGSGKTLRRRAGRRNGVRSLQGSAPSGAPPPSVPGQRDETKRAASYPGSATGAARKERAFMKSRKPVYDPQGVKGYEHNGRIWPLPVSFPDLDKEIAIPPGRPGFGTKEEYVDWVRGDLDPRLQDAGDRSLDRRDRGAVGSCHRPACRRRGHCSDPAVLCVYENDVELSETFLPGLQGRPQARPGTAHRRRRGHVGT